MKDKNHGDGQKHDEEHDAFEIIMTAVTALTILAILLEIATWFLK